MVTQTLTTLSDYHVWEEVQLGAPIRDPRYFRQDERTENINNYLRFYIIDNWYGV